jgi:hypothetical protein
VEPLLGEGHTLWMDNFYNAPALAKKLKYMKTDCVGTLCKNRTDVLKMAKEEKLRKLEIIPQNPGPVSVLKWNDKKNVMMISTFHRDETRKVKKMERRKRNTCVSYGLQSKYDRSLSER